MNTDPANRDTPRYECARSDCDWTNPAWAYGFAEAGAEWASHASSHRTPAPALVEEES